MASEIDRTQHEVEAYDVELLGGKGQNDKLGVRLEATPAGALVPRSMRPEETEGLTFGAAVLQFMVGRDAREVKQGDIILPLGDIEGRPVVGQTLAVGTGALLLTDQRAIGLVWKSTVSGPSLAAQINDDGSGSVIVFAADRTLLDDVELKTSFGGKIKSAKLIGHCFIDLIGPFALLDSGGEFHKNPHKYTLSEALRKFSEN